MRQVEKTIRNSVSADFLKPLNITCHDNKKKCVCMCSSECQSDGWCKCVPGLWFMKVKGPWGWTVKHIISVKLLDWMNQSIIIKHLWEGLELVEACAQPTSHSLAALVTRPYHLGMKLKRFSFMKLERHYYAVIHFRKCNPWHLLNV